MFVDDLGRLVTVAWGELGQDVVAAAEQLIPLDAATWGRWRTALAIDGRVDRVGPDADEVPVDAVPEGLIALVPRDFPLILGDQRRTCATFDLEGVRQVTTCASHPIWVATVDTVYLYGAAALGIDSVTVRPFASQVPPSDETPIEVIVHREPGWPNGVYVAELPSDWCQINVESAGSNGLNASTGAFGDMTCPS